MSTVYMMIGIQGSGKTTFAKVLSKGFNISVISSDELRINNPDLDEELVFPTLYQMCRDKILNNESFIYDATNITPKVRKRFVDSLTDLGVNKEMYDIVAVYFEPDVELSIERVSKRNKEGNERYMPIDVIKEYAKNIVEPTNDEGFSQIIKISRYFNKEVDEENK